MEDSAYLEMAATEDEHWWFVGRREIIDRTIASLGLPKGASILEVGAGTGGNLNMLSKHGSVAAMEMHDFARRHASDRSGIEVQDGFLPDRIPFDGRKFDLICLFDVLEHVEPHVESLSALSSRLADDGRILLTVPAYPWLWSDHDVILHHYRRYTRNSLRQTITDSGLKIERLTNFNAMLLPLAITARMVASMTGRSGSPGSRVPPAPINWAMRQVLSLEQPFASTVGLPFGLSLLAIARKA